MSKRPAKKRVLPPPSLVESKVEVARRPTKERVNPPSPIEPKVELAKRSIKEKVNPLLPSDKEEGKDEDKEMIVDNFSESGGDFDVLCNVVYVLPFKYDMVTKVTNAYENFSAEEMV